MNNRFYNTYTNVRLLNNQCKEENDMRNLLKYAVIISLFILLASNLVGCASKQATSPPETTTPPAQQPTTALTQPVAQKTVEFGPPSPLATSKPGEAATASQYAVILVSKGSVLNVRKSPGDASAVLETLPPHAAGFTLTGKTDQTGGENWVEVNRSGGGTGWVNARYITEYHPLDTFCGDAQVAGLLEAFKKSILSKDGKQLASLVSPTHGVTVQYLRGGKTATYTSDKALWLFSSTYQMDWGANPASGQEILASFHEEVLPRLEEVLGEGYTPACNSVQIGGASYKYQWPFEYGNINFYSLYYPGTAGNDQAWRTWLVGIEFVKGKPYLFSLVHLFWEP